MSSGIGSISIPVNAATNEQQIIRVFPRRTKWTPTDDLAFVGEPPLFDLPDLPVHISVTFTWDVAKAVALIISWRAKTHRNPFIAGPAWGKRDIGTNEFTPGLYVKRGVTFTSRGCPKRCAWCRVSKCEGKLREINIAPGYVVQDNNLLACSRGHIEKVFEMLRQQKRGIKFSGGLDIDYLQTWHVELLKTIRLDELWVACDCEKDLARLDKAADLLADFPIEKKRCYVMVGFGGEKLIDAERRLEAVYAKGFLPFCQPYKPVEAEFGWCPGEDRETILRVVRKWSRPATYRKNKLRDCGKNQWNQ